MPNWCYADVTFYSSNRDDVFRLRNKFTKIFNDNGYMRSYVEKFLPELNADEVNCRGSVIDIDDTVGKINNLYWFSMHTESAWEPKIALWREILKKHFPKVDLAYIAEEPGMELYEKWDSTGLFYPLTIRVSGYVPSKSGKTLYLDEDERSWSSDFQTAKEWLQKILPFTFNLTKGGDNINEKLEEYTESHHLEDDEDFWVSFGTFEECSPDEFEL